MPDIDGISAAREIRATPRAAAIPIVALTADTTTSSSWIQSEDCFDALLIKPITETELDATLARYLDLSVPTVGEDDGDQPAPAVAPARDVHRAVANAGGDAAVADELFRALLESLPEAHARILAARRDGDWDDLAVAVHKLKGSAAACATTGLLNATGLLDAAVKARDTAATDSALAGLENEIERLKGASNNP
jgi:CheY-like chemotaxis protein